MQKKIIFSATFLTILALLISIPLNTSNSFAQDVTPTPIGIEAEATEDDSAAPTLPDNFPSVEQAEDTNPESTAEAEATEAVDGEETAPEVSIDAVQSCPVAIQDSFTAVEILCADVASGEACIGNGTVDSIFGADVDNAFAQANDRTQITSLDQLTLTSSGTWTVIRAGLELPTVDGSSIVTTTMFAYGNLTLTDTGRVASGGARNGTVIAANGMNVRRAPGAEGVVVWQLGGGQEIIVTGITADREWIRMVIPNEFAGTGWVYAPYIDVEGGADTLTVVTVNSPVPDLAPPEFAPGQSFELLSALPPEDCDETVPVSGLLMQSPSGTSASLKIQINNAEIQFNGTIFIQAQAGDVLRISVLEGQATAIANGSDATATVDNRINIPLDSNLVVNGAPQSESFSASELPGIPTRLLSRNIAFGLGVVDTSEADENNTESTGFGTAVPTTAPDVCILTAPDEVRNVRAGASTEFEVIQVLQPGDTVEANGQAVGELNLIWYQTVTGGWIRIDTIESSASCNNLPEVEAPALPEATAVPEDASSSGLTTSALAEIVCDGSTITGTSTSDGTDTSIAIGGTWTASAGTSVTFATQGGMLRPEFGSLIKLIADDGTVIAESGEARSLTITFDTDTVFEARFSAANGDFVVISASCE